MAKQFFDNGYGISIISTETSYGGPEGLYECAVLKGTIENSKIYYDTPITDDVLGHCTQDDVNEIINQIKALPFPTDSIDEQIIADMEHRRKQALKPYGILNNIKDDDKPKPKKRIHLDGSSYAFVIDITATGWKYDLLTGNLVNNQYHAGPDWTIVEDLTGIPVYVYRELKEIAIAIGWIENTDNNWLI